jgi:hypothetical protein
MLTDIFIEQTDIIQLSELMIIFKVGRAGGSLLLALETK